MIRGGFLGVEDRNKLIALARDGSAGGRSPSLGPFDTAGSLAARSSRSHRMGVPAGRVGRSRDTDIVGY